MPSLKAFLNMVARCEPQTNSLFYLRGVRDRLAAEFKRRLDEPGCAAVESMIDVSGHEESAFFSLEWSSRGVIDCEDLCLLHKICLRIARIERKTLGLYWGCADLADTGKKRHRATKRV